MSSFETKNGFQRYTDHMGFDVKKCRSGSAHKSLCTELLPRHKSLRSQLFKRVTMFNTGQTRTLPAGIFISDQINFPCRLFF